MRRVLPGYGGQRGFEVVGVVMIALLLLSLVLGIWIWWIGGVVGSLLFYLVVVEVRAVRDVRVRDVMMTDFGDGLSVWALVVYTCG